MKPAEVAPLVIPALAMLAVAGVALYIVRKGGIAPAAQAVGAAAVTAAGSAASGAVGAVGASVGLPTPDQTVTDPVQVRWLIDHYGYWEASKWAGAPALIRAAGMDAGSGTAPPANAPVMQALSAVAAPQAAPNPAQGTPYVPTYIQPTPDASFSDLVNHNPYSPWINY